MSPGLASAMARSFAVVNHLRRPLVGAGLQVINPQPALSADDVRRVHAESAQLADGGVGDGIVGGSTVT